MPTAWIIEAPCGTGLRRERHRDARRRGHGGGDGLGVLAGGHDHLDRAGATGAERGGEEVVALTGLLVLRAAW
jgi:hypothetical protein